MKVTCEGFSGGSLQISTSVLERIAKLAALEVEGVAAVKSGVSEVKSILNKNGLNHSVVVSLQDSVADISIGIEVFYGYRVPNICSSVQENIKNAIQNMAGVTVSKVNIVVVGVSAQDESKE